MQAKLRDACFYKLLDGVPGLVHVDDSNLRSIHAAGMYPVRYRVKVETKKDAWDRFVASIRTSALVGGRCVVSQELSTGNRQSITFPTLSLAFMAIGVDNAWAVHYMHAHACRLRGDHVVVVAGAMAVFGRRHVQLIGQSLSAPKTALSLSMCAACGRPPAPLLNNQPAAGAPPGSFPVGPPVASTAADTPMPAIAPAGAADASYPDPLAPVSAAQGTPALLLESERAPVVWVVDRARFSCAIDGDESPNAVTIAWSRAQGDDGVVILTIPSIAYDARHFDASAIILRVHEKMSLMPFM